MEKWENPAVVSENLMDAHACFQEERVSLSGKWRFLCQSADTPLPESWEKPDFVDKKWRRIQVPGSWEAAELCEPYFRADSLPQAVGFSGTGECTIDQSKNLVGLYRRSFTLSKDQGSRQIILRFAAVSSCALVWVNGQSIGMVKGCTTAAEFDITSAVQPEKNIICVQVYRYSDVTCLEPKGAWLASGILGDVELYTLPSRCITDIKTDVRWQDDGTPLLCVGLRTRNADGFIARIALMDGNGVVGYCESPVTGDSASPVISCRDVKLWCAETPNLYRIAVILWDGIAIYHTRQLTIGFRRIDLSGSAMTINGQREKLLGVSYRPFDSATGCAPEQAALEQELRTIRTHNFNTLLLTGPAPDTLYEICDRIGLYILNESAAGNPPAKFTDYAAQENQRFLDAHSSHPSVIVWNGNTEAASMLRFDQFQRLMDPSLEQLNRIVGKDLSSEKSAVFRKRRTVSPVESTENRSNRPLILEFTGITDLPMAETVSLIRGFDLLCAAIFGTYQDVTFLSHTAPKASEVFVSSSGILRPAIREVRAALQPIRCRFADGTLTIENHSRFLSTGHYDCRYTLTRDGEAIVTKSLATDIAPGDIGNISLETKYDIFKPGRYHLSAEFLDRRDGTVVSFEQWQVAQLKHIYDENPGGTIREESGSIFLRSQNAVYVINRGTGNLEQIRLDERELLSETMYPVYSNRSANTAGFRFTDEWEKLTERKKKPKPSVLEVDHMTRTVTASFHLGSGLIQTYRLHSDGSLAVELRLRTGRTAPDRLGVQCALSEGMNRLRWFGFGPDDVWKDHRDGRFFGIHEQEVRKPDAPAGRKESVYTLTLCDATGIGIHVRNEEGLRAAAVSNGSGSNLTLELPVQEMKPHTTYTLGFTIMPIK